MKVMDDPKPQPTDSPGGAPSENAPAPIELPPLTPSEWRNKYLFRGTLALLLLLWFAYDGWYNTDPEMMKHRSFNRVGTVLLGIGLAYCLVQAVRYQLAIGRETPPNPPSSSEPR